jgi:hypothetical protein
MATTILQNESASAITQTSMVELEAFPLALMPKGTSPALAALIKAWRDKYNEFNEPALSEDRDSRDLSASLQAIERFPTRTAADIGAKAGLALFQLKGIDLDGDVMNIRSEMEFDDAAEAMLNATVNDVGNLIADDAVAYEAIEEAASAAHTIQALLRAMRGLVEEVAAIASCQPAIVQPIIGADLERIVLDMHSLMDLANDQADRAIAKTV